MRKMPNVCKKMIKIVSGALVGVMTISAVVQYIDITSLTAEAMEDTLPGIELIQNKYTNTDEVFRILEIAPNLDAAEVGFYIAGQEPLPSLKDTDNQGQWLSYETKLATFNTRDSRVAFMDTLKSEVTSIQELLGEGNPDAVISFQDYKEYDSEEEAAQAVGENGYKTFSLEERSVRGYFTAADSFVGGDWQVVFRETRNTVSVDSVLNGTTLPYYIAEAGNPLDKDDIIAWNEKAPDMMLYEEYNGVLKEALTVRQYVEYINGQPSVSDGNMESADTVSDGDAVSHDDAISMNSNTSYFLPVFRCTFGMSEADITGKAIYEAYRYAYTKDKGNYNLTATLSDKPGLELALPAEQVIYSGGIVNSDILRSKVLGLNTQEERDGFKMEVVTMTPGMLNQYSTNAETMDAFLKQFNMFYYTTGTLRKNENNVKYAFDLDFDSVTLNRLAVYLVKNEIPCVVECSEIATFADGSKTASLKGNNSVTKREKLLYVLMSPDKSVFFDGEDYNSLQSEYISFEDGNTLYKYITNDIKNNFFAADKETVTIHYQYNSDTVQYNDLYYVQDNVIVFYGDKHPFVRNNFSTVKFATDGTNTNPEDIRVAGGFQVVLDTIETENQYRKADYSYSNKQLLSTDIYDATVVRHILNYQNRRKEVKKTSLQVLEIQPATTKSQLTKDLVSSWTDRKVSADNITITTMPITQFIGEIDDLNEEYDLIYIGDAQDGLNAEWKWNSKANQSVYTTVYNDTSMNGLLYSHVGDMVMESLNLSGLLSTDQQADGTYKTRTEHRFSGNDLTVEKYNALLDYMDAYYPVVVAPGLASVSNQKVTINPDGVDASSYLYEMLDACKSRDNFFVLEKQNNTLKFNSNDASKFIFCLNKAKLSITYKDSLLQNSTPYARNTTVQEITANADGKYQLVYKFTLSNEGEVSTKTRYRCRLFLDANADGKFSTVNEELTGLTIRQSDGTAVASDELQTGVEYTVSKTLLDNYYGCVTWKLEVEQADNPYIRTSQTGYVKLKTDQVAVIKILQVYFNYDSNNNIILDKEIGKLQGNSYVDGKPNSEFYKCADALKSEYLLDITSMYRDDFDKFVKTFSALDENGNLVNTDDTVKTLDDYDMLMLGFSDAYNGNEDNDWTELAVANVLSFAEKGKSVLMGHDVTSVTNTDSKISGSSEWYWSYYMNRRIRDIVGMDMYGVTSGSVEADGTAKTTGPVKVDNRYQYGMKDVAWKPRSGRKTNEILKQVQGFTYPVLMTRDNWRDGDAYHSADGRYAYRSGMSYMTRRDMTFHTTNATKVNEGQIVQYPYAVGDFISIEKTHFQYYTLDMNSDTDQDGQTDLVVWYTLKKDNENYNSVKDVRNNYYLYSKGNIMYTGMGHSGKVSENEAKLFINTMIAAYQAGTRAPSIVVQNKVGAEAEVIYNYFDTSYDMEMTQAEKDSLSGQMQDVYFVINDTNMTSGQKTLNIECYVENGNGSSKIEKNGTKYKTTKIDDLEIYDMNGNRVTTFVPGSRYLLKVPLSMLQIDRMSDSDKNDIGSSVSIFIRAQTVIKANSIVSSQPQEQTSDWNIGEVRYMNVELFDLD